MTKAQKSLLKFPCDFPIKIVGKNSKTFEKEALKIIQQYHPKFLAENCVKNLSKNEKYLSITAIIKAQNQKQLDDLYTDLSKNKHTIMVL